MGGKRFTGRPAKGVIPEKEMKISTMNLCRKDLAIVEKLVMDGIYTSRSDAIRCILREGIKIVLKFVEFENKTLEAPKIQDCQLDPDVFIASDGRMYHITPTGVKTI